MHLSNKMQVLPKIYLKRLNSLAQLSMHYLNIIEIITK